jgi:Skp family chaperone for outer membrane proteins
LANALNLASALEAKLKATTKALGEADKKCAEEVAATKLTTNQEVKEAEARANKTKKSLAEVSKRQTQREEAIVKRINDLLTSISSKCSLPVGLY